MEGIKPFKCGERAHWAGYTDIKETHRERRLQNSRKRTVMKIIHVVGRKFTCKYFEYSEGSFKCITSKGKRALIVNTRVVISKVIVEGIQVDEQYGRSFR